MKIGKNAYQIGCEMANCINIANYRLVFDGELAHDLHICKECLYKMHSELNSFFKEKEQKKVNVAN